MARRPSPREADEGVVATATAPRRARRRTATRGRPRAPERAAPGASPPAASTPARGAGVAEEGTVTETAEPSPDRGGSGSCQVSAPVPGAPTRARAAETTPPGGPPAGAVAPPREATGQWRSRIVARGEETPAHLVANPRNWRGHPPAQQAALAGLLDQVGWVQDVVVNRRSGHLVDGHLRVELARARGEAAVPVVYVDLDDAEEALVLASLDPLAAMATADPAKLEALLREASVNDAALRAMLQDVAERAGVGADPKDGLTDPDDVPEPPESASTRPGDLWILGNHRLLCGDSGSPADLDRLLDGGPVHLLNTDPPYNVRVEPRSNNAIAAGLSSFQAPGASRPAVMHHQAADLDRHPEKSKPTHRRMRAKDRPLENDFMSDEAFRKKLRAWFGNAARVLLPGRGFFIWGGYSNVGSPGTELEFAL